MRSVFLALGFGAVLLVLGFRVQAQTQAPRSHAVRPPVSDLFEAALFEEANPFLSFLPAEVEADWDAWRQRITGAAARRSHRGASSVYEESEAPSVVGQNDLPASAEVLPMVAPGDILLVRGQVLTEEVELGALLDAGAEPGGSIPTSLELTGLGVIAGDRWVGDGFIGDGAFGSAGSASGDFDFFRWAGLAGQVLSVFVETPDPLVGLDPFVAVVDATGGVLAFSDVILEGGFFVSSDAALTLRLPLDGEYFILVGGSDDSSVVFPSDFFDPSSGPGVGTEGDYRLHFAVDSESLSGRDLFLLDLEAGDVFAATLREGAKHRIGLLDAAGGELVSSRFDLSGIYPLASPLPAGGDASVAFVAAESGRYYLSVEAAGSFVDSAYGVEVGLFPAGSSEAMVFGAGVLPVQGLFIDFDGASVDRNAFFSLPPGEQDLVSLSGLTSFLGRWNLGAEDESALIDAVLVEVERQMREMVAALGGNGDYEASGIEGEFGVEIRNSRDHTQQVGDSRVVVGGTVDELRLQTIGIAEAIDPGNFEPTKTAVVLLDLLSDEPSSPNSLNGVELASDAGFIDLLATGVGRIVAHEAGHLFGNFHTERDVGPATIMDSGGRLGLLLGLGEDGVFGSADDYPVGLGRDEYSRREPFRGFEETLEVVSFGLPVGFGASLRVVPGTVRFAGVAPSSFLTLPVSVTNDGIELLSVSASVAGEFRGSPSVFSVTPVGPVSLEPEETMTWMVTFRPTTSEAFEGQFNLVVGGRPQLERTVVLTGVGGAGVLSAGGIRLPVELPMIVYGPLVTTSQMFAISNTGSAPLDLAWEVQGAQAERFSVVLPQRNRARDSGVQVRLAPAESVMLQVDFDPGGAVGEANASLFLVDGLGGAAPLTVPMHGRSDGPDVSLEPRPYVFGALRADGATGRRIFRLRNNGTLPMSVFSATLRPGTLEVFELVPPSLPTTLQPQQQIGIDVTFRPTDAERYEGLLDVVSSDPDEPLAVVEMLGFGLLPMIEIYPGIIDVGQVPEGTEVSRILRIDNVGGATLRGSFELVDTGNGGVWSVSPTPGSLTVRPESFVELEVTFSAETALHSVSGALASATELRFETDDRDRPVVVVPLRQGSVLAVPTVGSVGLVLLALLLALCGVRWHRG